MTQPIARHRVRRALDYLYDAGAVLAAVCLVGILVVIVLQMVARWSDVIFPGSTQYAGYLMASSSFLAFAQALNRGAHIRVSLLVKALGRYGYWLDVWSFVIGTAATCYLAWYAVRMVYWSWFLQDVSQGLDATQLWIVQIPMAIGAMLLAVAFVDNTVSLVVTGHHHITADTGATGLGE